MGQKRGIKMELTLELIPHQDELVRSVEIFYL